MKKINWSKLYPLLFVAIALMLLNAPRVSYDSNYIDRDSDQIKQAIRWVEDRASSDKDKIEMTAEFINQHIEYNVTGRACFEQKASDVIINGNGDCVGMSKVATAMLQGMAIPVKVAEGCVFKYGDRQSELNITIIDNYETKTPENYTGRSTGPHGGQLHSWVHAYDGIRWWTIETTAGVVFPSNREDDYGYNRFSGFVDVKDAEDLCLLTDKEYVNFCKTY